MEIVDVTPVVGDGTASGNLPEEDSQPGAGVDASDSDVSGLDLDILAGGETPVPDLDEVPSSAPSDTLLRCRAFPWKKCSNRASASLS